MQDSSGDNDLSTSTNHVRIETPNSENQRYNVPADGSCLFWSVTTDYLLPFRNNNGEFRTRFIQLFGKEKLINLSHIQKLLQQFNLENHNNTQLWYS